MKCSFCNERAVYFNRAEGKYYCKKHFMEYFEEKVENTIRRFDLIRKNERVGVAVSGGKDSTCLLLVLKKLGYNVIGILIDEGIKGYREYTIEFLRRVSKEFDLDFQIFSFKDYFGKTLDEMVEIAKNTDLKPCTICGVFRRFLLNEAGKELKISKLATAHTINDEVQTFFMDIIRNHRKNLIRVGPKTSKIEGFVQRVKPFFFIHEKETMTYMLCHNLFPPLHECPYAPLGDRWKVRFFIYDIEKIHPGFHEKVAEIMIKIFEKYHGRVFELKKCKICGNPTNREICKVCEIMQKLGLKRF